MAMNLSLEQPAGIGPVYTAWEAIVLPLNYGCISKMPGVLLGILLIYLRIRSS